MAEKYQFFEPYEDRRFPLRATAVEQCTQLIHTVIHEDAEFLYIHKGIVTVYLGAVSYTCSAGDILYIAPMTVHSATAETPDAAIRGLVFRHSLLQGAMDEREYKRLTVCGDQYFAADNPAAAPLTAFFWQTTDAFTARRPTYRMETRGYLLLLFAELLQHCVTEDAPPDIYCRRIQPALDYIEEHFAERIALSDLSALISVSEDHFIRLFKQATQRTPFAYILDYRIEQALRLLGSDTYSIAQISDMTGFSNVQYFSQVFKDRVGVAPSVYRNPKRSF